MNAVEQLLTRLSHKTYDAEFKEEDHPRKANGQFGSGGGGGPPSETSGDVSKQIGKPFEESKTKNKADGGLPTISKTEAKDILSGKKAVPPGFFIHGRGNDKEFGNSDYPTQFGLDMGRAQLYGDETRGGSIWIAKPKPNAKEINLSSGSEDTRKFSDYVYEHLNWSEAEPAKEAAKNLLFERGIEDDSPNYDDELKKAVHDVISKMYDPDDIYENAGAYDSDEWLYMLAEMYPGGRPDFITTSEGAVMMPGSKDKIESINLTAISHGETASAKLGAKLRGASQS